MSFRLVLTGSIGMGKSTTAQMFRDLGHPVWDADAAVHRLYAAGGGAAGSIAAAFPGTVSGGAVDRAALKAQLAADPGGFPRLEAIVHPLVARDRAQFLARHPDAPIVVLDIPLYLETGGVVDADAVAVVSASGETQRQRVLARPGMTEAGFALILDRQMPDAEKRARADWVIPTETMASARAAVERICHEIRTRHA